MYSFSGHPAPPPPPSFMKRASDDVPLLSFETPSEARFIKEGGRGLERLIPQGLSIPSSFCGDYPRSQSMDSFSFAISSSSDSQAVKDIDIPIQSCSTQISSSSLHTQGYPSAMSNRVLSALDSVSDEEEQSSSEYVEGVSYRACKKPVKYKDIAARRPSFRQLPEMSAPADLEHQAKPHLQIYGRKAKVGKRPEFKSKVFREMSYLPPELCGLSTNGSLPDTAPAAVPSQMVVESDETAPLFVAQTARDRGPSFGSAKFTSSGFHSQLGSSSSTYDGAPGSTVVPVTSAPSDLEHQPKPDLCLKSLRRIRGPCRITTSYLASSLPPTCSDNDVPVGPAWAPEKAARLHLRGMAPSYRSRKVTSASQPHHELEAQSNVRQMFVVGHQDLPTNPVLRHQSAA